MPVRSPEPEAEPEPGKLFVLDASHEPEPEPSQQACFWASVDKPEGGGPGAPGPGRWRAGGCAARRGLRAGGGAVVTVVPVGGRAGGWVNGLGGALHAGG